LVEAIKHSPAQQARWVDGQVECLVRCHPYYSFHF